jgi:hypothetical protein
MGYLRPTDGRTLCSRDCHRGRNPPSQEAGTDIWAAFGTPLRAAGAGTVVDVGGGTGPATGYFVTIDLDDGRRIRYLHLWDRYVSRGDRVDRGTIFAQSGGSGYGSMTAAGGEGTVGQHVHVTLWPTHAYDFGSDARTLDFEQYADPIGSAAPSSTGGSAPVNQSWEDDMIALGITDKQGTVHYATLGLGVFRHLIESDDPTRMKNIVTSDDQWTWIDIDELPRLLTTYGIEDTNIYRVDDGQFVVRNSKDGVVRAGGMYRQR